MKREHNKGNIMKKPNIKLWGATLAFLLMASSAFAQATGSVRGRVLDSSNGDPMIGVTVVVDGVQGAFGITDIDGNYMIPAAPTGAQTIRFSMMGYQTVTTGVNVPAGGSARANVAMSYRTAKTIVVAAKKISNTQASLLTKQKKAPAAQDAISAEQIAKSPDSDAADAAKRVTGVSIMGGKYLFVRGLSERYSSISVNDSPVPSPLPNRKVVPLDIFPVSLLDNMIVSKTYLPTMPGDFGGGNVQLNTRNFPEEEEMKLSVGVGGNTQTTGKEFKSTNSGILDYLGWGAASRGIPDSFPVKTIINNGYYTAQKRNKYANAMRHEYTPEASTAMPGMSLAFDYGKTYKGEGTSQFGLLLSFSTKNGYQTYKDVIYKVYDPGYLLKVNQTYDQWDYTTSQTMQVSSAYRYNNNHQVKYNTFFTHQSESSYKEREGYLSLGKGTGKEVVNSYEETNLWFNQLMGEHAFSLLTEGTKFNWKGAYSLTTRNLPDVSSVLYGASGDIEADGGITKYFNEHLEHVAQGSGELELPFYQWMGLKSKFHLGNDFSTRLRDNRARRFQLKFMDSLNIVNGTASAETIVSTNAMVVDEITGTEQSTGLDSYEANLWVNGSYGMLDMPLFRTLRMVAGARAELWEQSVFTFSALTPEKKYKTQINGTDVLPSANLIFSPTDKMNIRLGYSRTLNRPEFIEMGEVRYFDDLETGFIIKGNPKLKQADIDNGDIRIEFFPSAAELISVSGFYKKITNPIEATVNVADDPTYTYANQKSADLYGGEFEVRKNFQFLAEALKELVFSFNYTYLYSEIELDPSLGGAETNSKRPLQGMSPYLVNLGLFYNLESTGTDFAVLYNIFGPRIVMVGVNGLEEIMEEPYHQLDFTVAQKIGKNGKLKLALGNLLDETSTQYIKNGSEKLVTKEYKKGTSISLGYSQSF